MAPQIMMIECLKKYKISAEVMKYIENNVQNKRVELSAGRKSLTEVNIKRGIFQGNVLSHYFL